MSDEITTVSPDGVAIEGTIGSSSEQNTPTQAVEEPTVETPEEQTPQEEAPKSEKPETVPYKRFKEVNDQMKAYKELLEIEKGAVTQPASVEVPQPVGTNTADEAINLVRQIARQEAGDVERRTASALELQNVAMANPDFLGYAEAVGAYKKANPTLSWNDAYKLAKYDSAQSEAREAGKKEAMQQVASKQKATAEVSKATLRGEQPKPIDPMARDPKTGKFLHNLKDLEEMLRR